MISNVRNKKSQCAIFSSPIFNKEGKIFPIPLGKKKQQYIFLQALPLNT